MPPDPALISQDRVDEVFDTVASLGKRAVSDLRVMFQSGDRPRRGALSAGDVEELGEFLHANPDKQAEILGSLVGLGTLPPEVVAEATLWELKQRVAARRDDSLRGIKPEDFASPLLNPDGDQRLVLLGLPPEGSADSSTIWPFILGNDLVLQPKGVHLHFALGTEPQEVAEMLRQTEGNFAGSVMVFPGPDTGSGVLPQDKDLVRALAAFYLRHGEP
ncbi:MAG: hypothetical protein DLM55_03060 [Acidimicrobiales bacterium]|nr:MAG: hypothetical protein DLM55_03060 [Acidimicrobiales bacterium]